MEDPPLRTLTPQRGRQLRLFEEPRDDELEDWLLGFSLLRCGSPGTLRWRKPASPAADDVPAQ